MENWKDIPGFEGRYQVSDLGRVRSLPRHHWVTSKRGLPFQRWKDGRVLKAGPHTSGYYMVQLIDEAGDLHPHLIHRLVALAFLPLQNGAHVNHKDGNKKNNCADNLEWATRSQNMRHAFDTGLAIGGGFPVIGVPINGGEEVRFESQIAAEIALSGKASSAIHHCISGKKRSAYGYTWRRA